MKMFDELQKPSQILLTYDGKAKKARIYIAYQGENEFLLECYSLGTDYKLSKEMIKGNSINKIKDNFLKDIKDADELKFRKCELFTISNLSAEILVDVLNAQQPSEEHYREDSNNGKPGKVNELKWAIRQLAVIDITTHEEHFAPDDASRCIIS